jgi:hypothetical protein
MNWLAYVRKSLTSLFGGVLVWAQLVPNFGHLGRGDWIGLAIVIGSAWGVYSVANGDRPVKAEPAPRAPLAAPQMPVWTVQTSPSSSTYGVTEGNPAAPPVAAVEPVPAVPAAV